MAKEGRRCNRLEIGRFLGLSHWAEGPAALSRSAGAIQDEKEGRNGGNREYACGSQDVTTEVLVDIACSRFWTMVI